MFITLQEYKSYASVTTPTEDIKLQYLVDMQNEFVASYTNVASDPITSPTVEIVDYLPLPNNRMVIDEDNIQAITMVNINGQDTDVTASLVRGYMVVFSREVQGTIKLTAEYKNVPDPIKGLEALKVAVLELTKFYHKQEYKVSVQAGGESIRFDSISYIPSHVKSILDMYRS